MRAREYKPAWGRFLTPDPAGIAFGDNRYAFVGGRPLTMMDPSGLDPELNRLYQQAWTTNFNWGSTGGLDNYYRNKYGLTSRYAAEMAGVRSTARSANRAQGNYGLATANQLLGFVDTGGTIALGRNAGETALKVAEGIVVGAAAGTVFKWLGG